ncbi:hypothetical protein MMC13_004846 [Lambiella insularis]|nr:hypothetical protein [Lambiella insularis]
MSTFMKLPTEIRLHILRQTDLVVYPGRFDWVEGLLISHTRSWHGTPSKAIRLANYEHQCCGKCGPADEPCRCPVHSQGQSATCVCYAGLTTLFRVSRQLNAEARSLFFSENHFILDGGFQDMLQWLKRIPKDMLEQIRSIELILPSISSVIPWHGVNQSLLSSWNSVIDLTGETFNMSNLFLVVNLGIKRAGDETGDMETFPDTYKLFILEPLRRLRGLRRFYAFLANAKEMEVEIEKAVMGEDYDSEIEGKDSARNRDRGHSFEPYYKSWQSFDEILGGAFD